MSTSSDASLRWKLLRHHMLSKAGKPLSQELVKVSRRPYGHFGLISFECVDSSEQLGEDERLGDTLIKYFLPSANMIQLTLCQRKEDKTDLTDISFSMRNKIDMTGLVGLWPAEEALTHFCMSNSSIFSGKRVLELGCGYGLAGLAIAACTDAAEVILTDGNPQVLEYVEYNIKKNAETFGKTKVHGTVLHWGNEVPNSLHQQFDVIVAADCTFFKESHAVLACTVQSLLKRSDSSHALFFNPQRNGSLDAFLKIARSSKLNVEMKQCYDNILWETHQRLIKGKVLDWKNYNSDTCYPILAVLTPLLTE